MTNSTEERTVCQTCGHIIAKPRKGLSSVLYRQIVMPLTTRDSLRSVKGKLYQIVQQGSNVKDFHIFSQNLDDRISNGTNIAEIKKWLLEQLVNLGINSGETNLYEFLNDSYPNGINEPFTTFYEAYSQWIKDDGELGKPMTKNFVFRALGAIGLKAKMVRIDFEDRKKSAMILKALRDKLHQLLKDHINLRNQFIDASS
jgi:hypothetical protein